MNLLSDIFIQSLIAKRIKIISEFYLSISNTSFTDDEVESKIL